MTLLGYQFIVVGLLSGLPLFWFWITPTMPEFVFLMGIGVFATLAQWAGIKALRFGEASVVGNMEYSKLIYAAVLGYLLFDEEPDTPTIAGGIIIIASMLYMLHREALNGRRTS